MNVCTVHYTEAVVHRVGKNNSNTLYLINRAVVLFLSIWANHGRQNTIILYCLQAFPLKILKQFDFFFGCAECTCLNLFYLKICFLFWMHKFNLRKDWFSNICASDQIDFLVSNNYIKKPMKMPKKNQSMNIQSKAILSVHPQIY